MGSTIIDIINIIKNIASGGYDKPVDNIIADIARIKYELIIYTIKSRLFDFMSKNKYPAKTNKLTAYKVYIPTDLVPFTR